MNQPLQVVEQPLWYAPLLYALSVFILVAFGSFGVVLSFFETKSTSSITNFITARQSVGLWAVTAGFYGSIVGAWILFLPAQLSGYLDGGWLVTVSSAFYSGIAPVIIVAAGKTIQNRTPNVLSFTDFSRRRFGVITWFITLFVMEFNMAAYLLSEYTSIAQLFLYIVDPLGKVIARPDIFIIVMVAGVVAIYTAVGGLKVSLITDQFQALLSIVLTIMLICWTAAKFRPNKSWQTYNELKLGKGNYVGGESWCSLGLSIITASFYNEAYWQRIIAAKSQKILYTAAALGGLLGFLQILYYGTIGTLVAWSNIPPIDPQGNLTFFTMFEGRYSEWITIIVVLCGLTMNESVVDSLQNGMLSAFTTGYLNIREFYKRRQRRKFQEKGLPKQKTSTQNTESTQDNKQPTTRWGRFKQTKLYSTLGVRIFVVLIQIILVPLALKGYSNLGIFYVMNVITVVIWAPQMIGIFVSPEYFLEYQQLFAMAMAFIAPHIYGICLLKNNNVVISDKVFNYTTSNVFGYVWSSVYNGYDFGIFLSAFLVGMLFSVLFIIGNVIFKKFKGTLPKDNLLKDMFNYKLEEINYDI